MTNSKRMNHGPVRRCPWHVVLALGLSAAAGLLWATPAAAVDCLDGDGDGYVVCGGCDLPPGTSCGECDDANPAINPGAQELCGDGIDNNCDGQGNDQVLFDLGKVCGLCDGPGCFGGFCIAGEDCPAENGQFCLTSSTVECSEDLLSSVCPIPPSGIDTWEAEGGGTNAERRADPTCSDAVDNDCDGFADLGDPLVAGDGDTGCVAAEICDALDNDDDGLADEDFPTLGQACTAGTGFCQDSGVNICSADKTGITCTAVPASPKTEGPFGAASCSDGIDNDCDGSTDFPDDLGCTAAETCDGLDNDGDGLVDEDFPTLGAACTVGVGACQATGSLICAADGSGTTCSSLPSLPAIEGLANPGSCSDGIDNDCDGLADTDDPTCASAGLAATCALPFFNPPKGKGRGKPGSDCNSWHVIEFGATGSDDAVVSAELIGLDLAGKQIAAIPVAYGDVTHMASRIDPEDFKLVTGTVKGGQTLHELFAPVPLLKVTAKDGYKTSHAYCSLVPYLDVKEPNGAVVSASEGDVTKVEVALPQVDPATLGLRVDGADVFAALGIDPATDLPGGPFAGPVLINGVMVQVDDLVVETPGFFDFAEPSSHTLTMTLTGLGCGGHVVAVDADDLADALPEPISSACNVDDMADCGQSSGFGIDIFSPTHLATGVPVPTQVTGNVCHGRSIEAVTVNGQPLDVAGNTTVTPGYSEGSCSASTVDFAIDVELPQTDLARDFATGDEPLATFDPGSNRIIASATDDLGNRTYNTGVVFATGEVANPGVGPLTLSTTQPLADLQLRAAVQQQLESEIRPYLLGQIQSKLGGPTVEIENAFVVGLTPSAINDLFGSKCTAVGEDGKTLGQKFAETVDSTVRSKTFDSVPVNFPCSCDLSLRLQVTAVSIDPNQVSCPVYFPGATDGDGDVVGNDVFRVFLNLPDVSVTLHDSDSCKTKVLGLCVAKSSASATITASVTDIHLKFDVTESQLKGLAGPAPTFAGGVTNTTSNISSSVGCIGGAICEGILGFFGFDITPNINVSNEVAFSTEIGAGEPDPIELGEIKVDEEEVAEVNQTLEGNLDTVDITGNGIVAGLTGRFATNTVDPEVQETPGASLTPAPAPTLPFGDDASVLLADDAINMMFASMTAGGALKTNCVASAKTVGDLLPADCQTISVELADPAAAEAATDAAKGVCEAVRGTDCETLIGSGFLTTPIEQGACHGIAGDSCSLIPAGFGSALFPADCESIVITLPDNPGLADTATVLLQGLCHGEAGDDCESLLGATDGQTAIEQGACHGVQAADCQTLVAPTFLTTPVERGTCEGVEGTDCTTLASGAQVTVCNTAQQAVAAVDGLLVTLEQQACNAAPPVNLHASQPLLFCSRQDIPPNFKAVDDAATAPVETALRLTDLSMAIAVDRDDNGFTGELSSTPNCFNASAPTVGDCLLAGLCLDLNIAASMELVAPPSAACGDKPGLITQINGLVATIRQAGVVCGGLPAGDDGSVVDNSASANESIDILEDNAEIFAPPICAKGLTLGGFVNFLDPRLIAVETDGDPSFQDYIGLTGNIDP